MKATDLDEKRLKNVEKTRRKKRQMWITLNLQLRERQIQENRHGLVSAS